MIAKPTNEEEVAMFRAKVDPWTCEIASARTSVGKATDNGLEPNHDRLVSDMLAPGYDRGYCQVADRRALEGGREAVRLGGSFYAGYCRRTPVDLPTT